MSDRRTAFHQKTSQVHEGDASVSRRCFSLNHAGLASGSSSSFPLPLPKPSTACQSPCSFEKLPSLPVSFFSILSTFSSLCLYHHNVGDSRLIRGGGVQVYGSSYTYNTHTLAISSRDIRYEIRVMKSELRSTLRNGMGLVRETKL